MTYVTFLHQSINYFDLFLLNQLMLTNARLINKLCRTEVFPILKYIIINAHCKFFASFDAWIYKELFARQINHITEFSF